MDDAPAPRAETLLERPDLLVTRTDVPPGAEIPWHRHGQVDDVFYGVRGRLTILTRDPEGRAVLAPGDLLRVARGRPHRVVNETAESAEYLLIQGIGAYDFVPD